MQSAIQAKVKKHQRGLYIVLIFPIAFTTLVTFVIARIFSYYFPEIGFRPTPYLHVHHYIYGFGILIVTAYLALIFNGPRAKFLISLLMGIGLGLAFDEFSYWFKLREDEVARWEYEGIVLLISFFFIALTLKPGLRFLHHHWPFSRKKLLEEHLASKTTWNNGNGKRT